MTCPGTACRGCTFCRARRQLAAALDRSLPALRQRVNAAQEPLRTVLACELAVDEARRAALPDRDLDGEVGDYWDQVIWPALPARDYTPAFLEYAQVVRLSREELALVRQHARLGMVLDRLTRIEELRGGRIAAVERDELELAYRDLPAKIAGLRAQMDALAQVMDTKMRFHAVVVADRERELAEQVAVEILTGERPAPTPPRPSKGRALLRRILDSQRPDFD